MTEGAAMDYAGLRRLLAHGWPVLLVDRVLALEPGVCLTAVKAVTGSEPCYRDLPRGLPADRYAYPVALMLESFGQAAAVLWLQTAAVQRKDSDGLLMFAAARNCVI
ncbi:MAG: 3-hydroxyacyl-ACP dehydratase FabZ family protein, partial [Stackebrandtia sp.]